MSRHIDQDALVSALEDICGGSGVGLTVKEGMLDIVRSFPATEVQEVVRCKDCKRCRKGDKDELWCAGHGYTQRLTTADDFCSKGVRQ